MFIRGWNNNPKLSIAQFYQSSEVPSVRLSRATVPITGFFPNFWITVGIQFVFYRLKYGYSLNISLHTISLLTRTRCCHQSLPSLFGFSWSSSFFLSLCRFTARNDKFELSCLSQKEWGQAVWLCKRVIRIKRFYFHSSWLFFWLPIGWAPGPEYPLCKTSRRLQSIRH